ncbi:MAG: phage holin family protein [Dehalococcoidia bacterium]
MKRRTYIWYSDQEEEPPESRLLSLIIRFGINAVALWLAAAWIRGIDIEGWQALLATAAIFGAVNAVVRPAAQLLGCPLTCLTLGVFAIVINAAMLGLTAWIAGQFDLNVDVDGFTAAFLGALLISFVSTLLSAFAGRPLRRMLT